MMTKDEAKELTDADVYNILNLFSCRDDVLIIQQNWPQISKQLDKWFTYDRPRRRWHEADEVIEDPIGWMLRAYIGVKQNG